MEKEDIKFGRMSEDNIVYLRCNSNMENTNGINRNEGTKTNV